MRTTCPKLLCEYKRPLDHHHSITSPCHTTVSEATKIAAVVASPEPPPAPAKKSLYITVIFSFYSWSALLTMLAPLYYLRPCPSPRLSVRPSVTFRCFVETNEATIMRFSLPGSTIILVSGKLKIIWKFAGDHP